jgi:hypothetical protein
MSNFMTVDCGGSSQTQFADCRGVGVLSLPYCTNGKPRLVTWKGEIFGMAYSHVFHHMAKKCTIRQWEMMHSFNG